MKPEQQKLYEAICEADPECRCSLTLRLFQDSDGDFYMPGSGSCATGLAHAAIRDHLHTRLEIFRQLLRGPFITLGPWGSWNAIGADNGTILPNGGDKLDALLAAHAARLGVEKESK